MFIVLDAIDGAGKGRQRIEIASYLDLLGVKVESVEFPVHNAFYETVIHPALQGEKKLNKSSWVLSYLLDKTMISDKIRPFVHNKKKFFIADGYFTTTIAYQSYLMEQIELDRLLELGVEFDIPVPDLAIFIDVDPETAMQRKNKEEGHDEGLDMFEKSLSKQRKLRDTYTEMVEQNIYCDWEIVDGNGTVEEVKKQIIGIMGDHYEIENK
ncbi:MAG: dTMP kinase [Candidatus Dojkabacteria bacterium]